MTFNSIAIVTATIALLLTAASMSSKPAKTVTSLEAGLGPKVTARPL